MLNSNKFYLILSEIKDLKESMKEQFLAIRTEFDDKLVVVTEQMNARFENLESPAISNNVMHVGIKTQFTVMEEKLDNLDRMNALNHIVLSGIPILSNEDLPSIMSKICSTIDFGKTDNILNLSHIGFETNSRIYI